MREVYLLLGILAAGLPAARGQNLNCNFEQNFCQWTQASSDKTDWLRISGSTPSGATGPPHDHTSGHGNYAYFEATNTTQGFNAQLTSPALRVSSRSKACLSFWYYMYGQHVNSLNVYLQKNNNNGQPVWQRTGNQGSRWIQGLVDIPVNTRAKVVLEAVRGRGYRGDIAIDDITYKASPCPQSGVNTTTSVQCNFEDGRICGYTQDQTDNFDWTRASGATLTSGTGPNSDHTYNTQQGHYMYIDASNAQSGQKARLVSPSSNGRRSMCMTFYYSMYGTGVDSLNVYTKSGRSLGQPIWSLSGNQGVGWNIARVPLRRGRSFNARIKLLAYNKCHSIMVVFEAVRGQGFKGDIAIDDVSLAAGNCPAIGACNFDKNLCGWTNAKQDDFDWLRHRGSTGSRNTGPSSDHTHSNSQGYYLYIEASSPRRENDRARLTSQLFRKSSRPRCFQFWYNMQGSNIGTLTVIMNVNSVDKPIWTLTGQQNGNWIFGRVPITNNQNNFKLAIVGTRGNGVQGDIALDDFSVRNSRCTISPSSAQPSTAVTTKPPTTVTTKSTTPGGTPSPSSTNSVTCNFDTNFCGWTNPKTDDFDWTRQNQPTNSARTGPQSDHTSGHGYYVFTESSNRRPNQKALLQSVQVQQTGPHCLSFWYHMYGSNIGTLNLYVQTGATPGSPEWTRSGEQGNAWRTTNVTFTPAAPFNLIFEGVMANGYRGDISLDDVTLTSGTCSGSSSSSISGRACSFEDTHICGYTQDKTDVFDWTRNSGATGSTSTGPSNDHTYKTSRGHYMYIEASAPRHQGDNARLISPTYTDSQAMCVQFYYHMYGNGIGALNVYVQTGGQMGRAGFTMSANAGNVWQLGEMTVPSSAATAGYKVVFEGVVGGNVRSDIAIDDIMFKSGPCQNPGECDFETGLCSWKNVQNTGDQFDWTIKQGQTSSTGTGPSSDHTVGTAAGHYMYIETSSPRLSGNIAWLVSEVFPPTSASGRCLNFWYNMYGQTIDTLTALVRVQGAADTAIWSLTGNQGQQWQYANAPISMPSSSYQIVFQGRRGTSVTGDIAIDDISFAESNCGVRPSEAHPIVGPTTQSTPSTTPGTQGAFNCSFDNSFCGWSQDHTDQFDWTRMRGRTPSSATGPTRDHTSGRGYYVYAEASTPRRNGDKARLLSPDVAVTGTQTKCLTFWYLMMGRNVAQLSVYAKSGIALPSTPIWKRSGNQGNRWIKAQVDITAKSLFNVVFEAVRGGAYGDIAVDDVGISDGSCTHSK
ncbi:MAM and LDL-receptor class A domain-containing protein 1-like [Argopecten irradians]|uniref:MAM and LDL-receptor class A domain-containing protein 1-like n=1 Tax=Argopecten irradians TaxID=31199 RepID=UPI00371ED2C9